MSYFRRMCLSTSSTMLAGPPRLAHDLPEPNVKGKQGVHGPPPYQIAVTSRGGRTIADARMGSMAELLDLVSVDYPMMRVDQVQELLEGVREALPTLGYAACSLRLTRRLADGLVALATQREAVKAHFLDSEPPHAGREAAAELVALVHVRGVSSLLDADSDARRCRALAYYDVAESPVHDPASEVVVDAMAPLTGEETWAPGALDDDDADAEALAEDFTEPPRNGWAQHVESREIPGPEEAKRRLLNLACLPTYPSLAALPAARWLGSSGPGLAEELCLLVSRAPVLGAQELGSAVDCWSRLLVDRMARNPHEVPAHLPRLVAALDALGPELARHWRTRAFAALLQADAMGPEAGSGPQRLRTAGPDTLAALREETIALVSWLQSDPCAAAEAWPTAQVAVRFWVGPPTLVEAATWPRPANETLSPLVDSGLWALYCHALKVGAMPQGTDHDAWDGALIACCTSAQLASLAARVPSFTRCTTRPADAGCAAPPSADRQAWVWCWESRRHVDDLDETLVAALGAADLLAAGNQLTSASDLSHECWATAMAAVHSLCRTVDALAALGVATHETKVAVLARTLLDQAHGLAGAILAGADTSDAGRQEKTRAAARVLRAKAKLACGAALGSGGGRSKYAD